MKAVNCDVLGKKGIENNRRELVLPDGEYDKGELVLTDIEKHLAWKKPHERLLNVEFPCDKESLVLEDLV